MQRRMAVGYDVSEQSMGPIFNDQADLIYTAAEAWDEANVDLDPYQGWPQCKCLQVAYKTDIQEVHMHTWLIVKGAVQVFIKKRDP